MDSGLSKLANTLKESSILEIAQKVRDKKAEGIDMINFTVGDYSPAEFPIPKFLSDRVAHYYQTGATNYSPPTGQVVLREALKAYYEKNFDLGLPIEFGNFAVASGARPLIYTTFRAITDPGDTVLYSVPSWNNHHYIGMCGCVPKVISSPWEQAYLPKVDDIISNLEGVRLLCLNSPLNPSGTHFEDDDLKAICDAVVAENKRRKGTGEKDLFMLFDMIYFQFVFGDKKFSHPLKLCPELNEYFIGIDGVSKNFCGTGVRVGWSLAPKDVNKVLTKMAGHVGAWAPTPEQLATADFLKETAEVDTYLAATKDKLEGRLQRVYGIIQNFKQQGYDVDAIAPQGGIYLSFKINIKEDNSTFVKKFIDEDHIAMIPMDAFGLDSDLARGQFRISVGACSDDEISRFEEHLGRYLKK